MTLQPLMSFQAMDFRPLTDWHTIDKVRDNSSLSVMINLKVELNSGQCKKGDCSSKKTTIQRSNRFLANEPSAWSRPTGIGNLVYHIIKIT